MLQLKTKSRPDQYAFSTTHAFAGSGDLCTLQAMFDPDKRFGEKIKAAIMNVKSTIDIVKAAIVLLEFAIVRFELVLDAVESSVNMREARIHVCTQLADVSAQVIHEILQLRIHGIR
jgi:hypothetical protein